MAGPTTGKHVLYDVSLVLNSVDLSDHVDSVEFHVGTNKQPGAAMGTLQDASIAGTLTVSDPKMTFFQDYNTSKVYQTMLALWQARTTFNVVAKASSAAKGPTNPEWTIPVFIAEMPLMTGGRGDRHMAPVTLAVAGDLSIAIA
jgi:hypothetical protein